MPRDTLVLLLMLPLLGGCLAARAAERAPIDCSVAKPDLTEQRCQVVRRASEFGNACIPNSAFSGHTCLVMDTDIRLCPSESPFPLTVLLDHDDVTLDCAGGSIDHGWPLEALDSDTEPEPAPLTRKNNLFPGIHAPSDRSMRDVTIRRCTIARTGHMGINLTRFFGGQLETGELPLGHRDILIEDVNIRDVITGIFIGTYSRAVTMDRIRIENTQRISLYSEAGSHQIKLRDSLVANNRTREAVALDSTYDSEISDTLFANNREGAVNLYQNCGELKGIVCPVARTTPPNNNRLLSNTFLNNGEAGLQIASRQGRYHSRGWCQSLDGRAGQFHDTARDNVVQDNTFICHHGTALRVMDGPNVIRGNSIRAHGRCVPLEISTGELEERDAGHTLDGLVVEDNVIDSERPPRLRNVGNGVELRP